MEQPHTPDIETLVALATRIADHKTDGHLTILRFTSGWKCGFGTPTLDSADGRREVAALPSFPTFREAMLHLITTQQSIGTPANVSPHR